MVCFSCGVVNNFNVKFCGDEAGIWAGDLVGTCLHMSFPSLIHAECLMYTLILQMTDLLWDHFLIV